MSNAIVIVFILMAFKQIWCCGAGLLKLDDWFGMKLSWWCKKSDYWCCVDSHINLIAYLDEERLSGIDSRQQRVGHPNILLFYFYNHTIKEDTEKIVLPIYASFFESVIASSPMACHPTALES